MAKEIKIGIFAVVAIVIGIFGYNYLKGKNLFGASNIFYIEYGHVQQLQNSAPVLINGLQVGVVKDIYLNPQDYTKIIVEIEIDNEIKIPKDAIAEIMSTSLMGGKAINLVFDNFCTGDNCAKSGDYLEGRTIGLLDSMVGTETIDEYMDAINRGVGNMMDTISEEVSAEDSEVGKTFRDLQAAIYNLKLTTANLNNILVASGSDIKSSMKNLEVLTGSLSESSDKIKNIISNAETFSQDLREMNLKNLSKEATETFNGLKVAVASADHTFKDLNTITTRIKSGEGTLGKLIYDKKLYESLSTTTNNLDLLLQDIRLNPHRYRRILSGKKIPYEVPENDPADQGGDN